MKSLLTILFPLVFLFTNCQTSPRNPTSENTKTPNDSIQIRKLYYKNSPNVIEYEIPVLKGTETRHGVQKRFYLHGSLYSKIPYNRGKREGTAFTYYPGTIESELAIWKEQPYVNHRLEGICRRFHKNGNIQAEYEYKNGNPAIGTKEYSESGKPVTLPGLILTKSKLSDGYYLTARLSNNSKNVNYYIGELHEGKYLPKGLKGLQVKKGLGEIVIYKNTKKVTITAVYVTKYRNKCLISKTIIL